MSTDWMRGFVVPAGLVAAIMFISVWILETMTLFPNGLLSILLQSSGGSLPPPDSPAGLMLMLLAPLTKVDSLTLTTFALLAILPALLVLLVHVEALLIELRELLRERAKLPGEEVFQFYNQNSYDKGINNCGSSTLARFKRPVPM